jgi:hypothetical protein
MHHAFFFYLSFKKKKIGASGAWPSGSQILESRLPNHVLPDIWELIPQTHQRFWESAPKKIKTPEGLGVNAPKPSGFGGLVIKKKKTAARMIPPSHGECS